MADAKHPTSGRDEPDSNYERTKRATALEFLKYDSEAIANKWHLELDEEYLYLLFFGERYRVSRTTGVVEYACEPGESTWYEAEFGPAMTIYDILCYGSADVPPAAEFVPVPSLARVLSSTSYAGAGAYASYERFFNAEPEAFRTALVRVGGQPFNIGDISYRLPVFDGFDVVLDFWLEDEEFAPSLTPLVDRNILSIMHYETIWYMVGFILQVLKQLCEEAE